MQHFADAVRAQWGIGRGVPWVLDMAFGVDASRLRVGHAAANLAGLRRLALHLLRREVRAKVGLKAGWDNASLLTVLTGYDAIALGRCPGEFDSQEAPLLN